MSHFLTLTIMQLNTDILSAWFTLFNQEYFDGRLPVPVLAVGKSRTRLGSLTWKYRRKLLSKQPCGYTIRVSNYYDADETAFKNVLLHEMIHLYIVSNRLKDTSPHGVVFRREMRRINADGWSVSVSAKVDGMAKSASVKARRRQRLVLAVAMKDGKRLLSVVSPRHARRIDGVIGRSENVEWHSWQVSSDEYFASFPTVRTPKGRIVTPDVFNRMLSSMTPVNT